jgi:hypothetical protein
VLQNIASVMTCVRQHETNSRWLMERLGQIENAVNKKTYSNSQQVSIATIMSTWANFKSHILKTRVMHVRECTYTHMYM